MLTKMPNTQVQIPVITGGWQGTASLPIYEMLRSQRFTMDEIAAAFQVSRRGLYNLIARAKEGAGTAPPNPATTDEFEDFKNNRRHSESTSNDQPHKESE